MKFLSCKLLNLPLFLVQGYCADYSELVEKLSCQTMSEREMGKWLRALKLCVSQLNQDCELLVVATLVSLPGTLTSNS